MVDQTDDIFHIEHPCSFKHNQIHIKNIKVLSPTNTLQWTHIAMCSNITLQLFFVKIAYNYFSSAKGHISEVITHTHRSSFIVVMKRERERQEGVKMISYVAHVPLDKGVCVCVCAISFHCLFDTYHRMLISIRSIQKIIFCWLFHTFNMLYQHHFFVAYWA
jgi:hypothetical protein